MYSKEFVDRVKKVYVNSPTIIELAENGSDVLGHYLDDSSNATLSPSDVLNSTYEQLVEWAHKTQEKRDLYRDWSNGHCYDNNELEEKMCPILYMQNNGDTNKMYMEAKICQGVDYVSYFPSCKKWGCKKDCWKKYYQLKDGVE